MSLKPSSATTYKQAQANHHLNVLRQLVKKPEISIQTSSTCSRPTSCSSFPYHGAGLTTLINSDTGDSHCTHYSTSASTRWSEIDMSYTTYIESSLAMGRQNVQHGSGKDAMPFAIYNSSNVGCEDLAHNSVNIWQNPLADNDKYHSAGTLPCLGTNPQLPPRHLHTFLPSSPSR